MTSSVSTSILLERIGLRLMKMTPTPQPILTRYIDNNVDALPMPDVPFAVLRFARGVQNVLRFQSMNLTGRSDYTVEIYIFLAGSELPEEEKHERLKPYPHELLRVLGTDVQLASASGPPYSSTNPAIAADHIGGEPFQILWEPVEQQWGEDKTNFFGIHALLQVTQKFELTAPS